jgi:ABC-2 type transport system permease protein
MWLTMIVGVLCARFRDVPQIVANLMQVLFLITPVLWSEKGAPETLQTIASVNPLTHFLAIAREPLLGQTGLAMSWLVVGVVTIAGWAVAITALRLCRTRIAYWV